jgi:cell division protease FtsH
MKTDLDRKKRIINILCILLVAFLLYSLLIQPIFSDNKQAVPYNALIEAIVDGKTDAIRILSDGKTVVYETSSGSMTTVLPGSGENIANLANANNVAVYAEPPPKSSIFWTLFLVFAPILLLVYLFSKMGQRRDGKGILSIGMSKAKLIDPTTNDITLRDVISNPGEHTEATEVIDFLKDPERFHRAKAEFPRGILLSGPPGVGKTLLAKAIAGEAGVPFYTISGSEFVEMFVGVGASRVRSLFADAKQHPAAIIFIDEIDAVGGSRDVSAHRGNSEREQTLNQLLVEMDGFDKNSGILILAATNRPDMLDKALLRPGRFDRIINCSLPDVNAREKIISLNLNNVNPEVGIDCARLARGTTGFSGAELAKMVKEAAIFAARENRTFVNMGDLEKAKDKVMMGAESPRKMSDSEKENTAYHEAGHAIVGWLAPEHDPVYKVSIIPRGRALGVTQYQPKEDVYSYSKTKLEGMVLSLLGGRAAEEITMGNKGITTGAANDLERATSLVRNMVTRWGFGDIGLMSVTTNENGLGQVYSENTGQKIDENIQKCLELAYEKVLKILTDNRDKLDTMKDMLITKETIDSDDIDAIMNADIDTEITTLTSVTTSDVNLLD